MSNHRSESHGSMHVTGTLILLFVPFLRTVQRTCVNNFCSHVCELLWVCLASNLLIISRIVGRISMKSVFP